MTVKLYVSFATDMIAVILMICQLFRTNKLSKEKGKIKQYFCRFSWLVIIMSVFHLLKSYADAVQGVVTLQDLGRLSEVEAEVWYLTQIGATFIDIFLGSVFLYLWISFLCLYLFNDRDYIKRKFWLNFTPLIISAVVSFISLPMAAMSKWGLLFFVAVIIVAFIVRIFYLLISLGLLRGYKKHNGYLRFFNPWVFFIPVALSWILQDIFEWGVGALGTAVGVFLLFISIAAEERYMDPATKFYNMDFTGYLKKLSKADKYAPCSAMTFTLDSPEKMGEFSKILKEQLPTDCEPIIHNDHEIVVLTNVREKGRLMMVTGDVQAVYEVKASCTLKKKAETTEEFMERVL